MKFRILLLASIALLSSNALSQVFYKSNDVYNVYLNQDGYPIVTTVRVAGSDYIPHDNAGADLSIAIRSAQSNQYNPTLGGDCAGNASSLWGHILNWDGSGLGIPASNGIALGVEPRFYNENNATDPDDIVCGGTGDIAPFNMTFGVTLGDGANIPNEVIVLDMSFAREDEGEAIRSISSEFPAMFANRSSFKYLYYSYDGDTWYQWQNNGTHNVSNWDSSPNSPNYYKDVQAVWVSNESNAISNPSSGSGIGIYVNGITSFAAGKRTGQSNDLVYIAALGDDSSSVQFNDDYWHGWRRLVVVGNLQTVKNSIDQAVSHIGGSGDWTWTDTTTPRYSDY